MAGTEEDAVRARLNEIALRYPQAEIARRTRSPGSTVSRYLKDNRIPVSFVVAVGREFGVNPAWLLFGEGAPWLADVAADEGKMGGKLVELVQTMSKLSKLKLGALAGKQTAVNLRELNDALDAFERTREQLARQSRETYARVLDDWNRAINVRNVPVAQRLAKAAEQIARLCPDEALARQHERQRGAHEYFAGSMERALQHRKRAYFSSLPEAGKMDDPSFVQAFSVVVTLDAMGRATEAVRFAQAVLKLAPHATQFPSYHRCMGAYGWVLIQAGFPHKGLTVTMRALAGKLSEGSRQSCLFNMAYAMYISGACDLARAATLIEGDHRDIAPILFLSPWSRDVALLEKLLARYRKTGSNEVKNPGVWTARAHLLSLKGKHELALKHWQDAEAYQPTRVGANAHRTEFTLSAMRTQLLRAAGRKKQALDALDSAEQARNSCGEGVSLELSWRRVHWRNVLALCSKGALHQQALKFDQFCKKRGIVFGPDSSTPKDV